MAAAGRKNPLGKRIDRERPGFRVFFLSKTAWRDPHFLSLVTQPQYKTVEKVYRCTNRTEAKHILAGYRYPAVSGNETSHLVAGDRKRKSDKYDPIERSLCSDAP